MFRLGPPVAAIVLLMSLAEPLTGQGCRFSARAGVAAPLNDVPPAAADLVLDAGLAGGVGLNCGDSPVLGVSLAVHDLGWLRTGYALGSLGKQLHLGQAARSPWLRLSGQAGLALVTDFPNTSLTQILGHTTKVPSIGFALGAGARVGFPVGGGAVFVDGTILATFLGTEFTGRPPLEDPGGGLTSLWSVPVMVGFEFRP